MPQCVNRRKGWLTGMKVCTAVAVDALTEGVAPGPQPEIRIATTTNPTPRRIALETQEQTESSPLDYVAMTPAEARDALTRLLQTPEKDLDLAEAALLIAAEEYPELRPVVYLNQIARMSTELKLRIRAEVEPSRVVEKTNTYMFEELHFKGNREEYYDPRNSFLNEVIDRRVGIPITLAVLYVAVGEKAGLPVRGVDRAAPDAAALPAGPTRRDP